jgi:hypothetical protein
MLGVTRPSPTKGSHLPSPIGPTDGTKLTDTRRGRAWIDRIAGVRIGYTLAGISLGTSSQGCG